ncbi:conserved hypothetical Protein [Bradyrhizobium sp. ORS 278]|uniref:AbiTii domain-containing protein n=1 Tax=Bradyrhizobium sp. (strain ORS 278) TaxID=114615 RepID=UPI0001508C77|nr:hypothetical protein [Bradyrhizobium sp. ORS 278]CAL77688.1 conserved hypothetical Protein [Bradyrhizobium sp. ORS 278]
MSILREIQAAILQENPDLGTILLKLRFLASRLGSEPLEDWVRFEAEGYSKEAVTVPSYRVVPLSFSGSWSGPFGSGIRNAPIPTYLVEMHAGKGSAESKIRESIATVQEMASRESGIGVNASNLILLLQGKVYEDYACNEITAEISQVALREIVQTVRARILELTIELEKRVPAAVEVTLHQVVGQPADSAATVTQIFNQTVYGNVTHVTATEGAQVSLAIVAGDAVSMVSELAKAGLPADAAKEITDIVAEENPQSADKPLGPKALAWLKKNAPKVASGAWKIGSAVATDLLKEAALKYYGLK